jgi:hypothetical protein
MTEEWEPERVVLLPAAACLMVELLCGEAMQIQMKMR